ncbi:MAG: indolepyruvate ferredoxin oxidoreductase subunit alpha [Spirochaetales bacterium]|nr:indolepyruvate ferredoxin oxidoreductase subunit alpha [Spirochaetales bacterium]
MEKRLLSGNEAIARGAFEAGVTVGTGYPGTPSTEILENLTTYEGVYTEWSVNEKVALEVGIGAALAGARTLVTMKHVGLNVAADPLFTSSYIGVKGGLVIANADDPNMHSSQNEQDNRHYAYAAKVPMLEPADSEEARQFTKLAFEMSEAYDTPVILRSTTRISHAKGVVLLENPDRSRKASGFERNIKKYVMIPGHARLRHIEVEKRMERLGKDVNASPVNVIEMNDPAVGIITSGICYTYVKEALPEASVLKLGIVNPLPEELIRRFFSSCKKVCIVEELDPYLELRVKAMGFKVEGKSLFSSVGELDPDAIRKAFGVKTTPALPSSVQLPPRPPSLCPGCPHRTVFKILNQMGLIVTGDIGCYTLGVMPPFSAMDTCVEMGGSIGLLQGIEVAMDGSGSKSAAGVKMTAVGVIGDSTFAHSGISGLINAAYNGRKSLFIVLDNGTTAMTGMQPNPFSGERINGQEAFSLDYEKLGEACGIKNGNVRIVDAYKPKDVEESIRALLDSGSLALLVIKGPCVIYKRKKMKNKDKKPV